MKKQKRKLPEGWKLKKLGGQDGIAEIINGSTPSTDCPEYWDGDILWATPSDMGKLNSIYIENTERKITRAGMESCSTTLLPIGTVLLTSRAPVGNLAITKKPFCTNQGFKSFIPKEGVNNLYLYFALKQIIPSIQKQSHGNTFTEITKELVRDFQVPVPSTEDEQIKIAKELERKTDEIEKMRQAALKQKDAISVMQGAILRGVFPYKDGDKLPRGWKWASLGDTSLVTLIMGQSPPSETYNKEQKGLPFFQGCTDFGRINPEPTVWCSYPNRIAEPNDILMSVRAPVGPTNIAKEKCCIGRGVAAIRCREGLSYKYLISVLRKFEREITSEGSGSIFGAIGKDELKAVRFPIPLDIKEQINIADKLDEKINNLEKMNDAINKKLEAIEAMQGAILREIFDFEEVKK